jgi:hypothetical protein
MKKKIFATKPLSREKTNSKNKSHNLISLNTQVNSILKNNQSLGLNFKNSSISPIGQLVSSLDNNNNILKNQNHSQSHSQAQNNQQIKKDTLNNNLNHNLNLNLHSNYHSHHQHNNQSHSLSPSPVKENATNYENAISKMFKYLEDKVSSDVYDGLKNLMSDELKAKNGRNSNNKNVQEVLNLLTRNSRNSQNFQETGNFENTHNINNLSTTKSNNNLIDMNNLKEKENKLPNLITNVNNKINNLLAITSSTSNNNLKLSYDLTNTNSSKNTQTHSSHPSKEANNPTSNSNIFSNAIPNINANAWSNNNLKDINLEDKKNNLLTTGIATNINSNIVTLSAISLNPNSANRVKKANEKGGSASLNKPLTPKGANCFNSNNRDLSAGHSNTNSSNINVNISNLNSLKNQNSNFNFKNYLNLSTMNKKQGNLTNITNTTNITGNATHDSKDNVIGYPIIQISNNPTNCTNNSNSVNLKNSLFNISKQGPTAHLTSSNTTHLSKFKSLVTSKTQANSVSKSNSIEATNPRSVLNSLSKSKSKSKSRMAVDNNNNCEAQNIISNNATKKEIVNLTTKNNISDKEKNSNNPATSFVKLNSKLMKKTGISGISPENRNLASVIGNINNYNTNNSITSTNNQNFSSNNFSSNPVKNTSHTNTNTNINTNLSSQTTSHPSHILSQTFMNDKLKKPKQNLSSYSGIESNTSNNINSLLSPPNNHSSNISIKKLPVTLNSTIKKNDNNNQKHLNVKKIIHSGINRPENYKDNLASYNRMKPSTFLGEKNSISTGINTTGNLPPSSTHKRNANHTLNPFDKRNANSHTLQNTTGRETSISNNTNNSLNLAADTSTKRFASNASKKIMDMTYNPSKDTTREKLNLQSTTTKYIDLNDIGNTNLYNNLIEIKGEARPKSDNFEIIKEIKLNLDENLKNMFNFSYENFHKEHSESGFSTKKSMDISMQENNFTESDGDKIRENSVDQNQSQSQDQINNLAKENYNCNIKIQEEEIDSLDHEDEDEDEGDIKVTPI